MYGTGCNTDGQIGLGDASGDVCGFTQIALPSEVVQEGGVARISAGADTSALVTASGRVWTWGNSVSNSGPATSEKMFCGSADHFHDCAGIRPSATRSQDRPDPAPARHRPLIRASKSATRRLPLRRFFCSRPRRYVVPTSIPRTNLKIEAGFVPPGSTVPNKGGRKDDRCRGHRICSVGSCDSERKGPSNSGWSVPITGSAEMSLYRIGIGELFLFPRMRAGSEKLHTIRKPSPDLPLTKASSRHSARHDMH